MLILYGGDNATLPRAELIAWIATTPRLNAEPTIVAEDVPNSTGSINDRVTEAIEDADKAIALVTVDPRSKFGAPNILEEIGRWIQGKGASTLCVVRQVGTEVNSNMQGHVFLQFDKRIKEVYEGLRKFLDEPLANVGVKAKPSRKDSVLDSSDSYVLLSGRIYKRSRVEEEERVVRAVLDCDGPAAAALRALQRRSQVELTFGNHVVVGRLDDVRLTHEGAKQLATVAINVGDRDQSNGHIHDVSFGGGSGRSLSADDIAQLRASRLLTDEPKSSNSSELLGPEMFIKGVHGGVQVERSPIPGLLSAMDHHDPLTWEHIRLELVRQLILSYAVDRIESLVLTVSSDKLVHVTMRGLRQRYANQKPFVVCVDAAVTF